MATASMPDTLMESTAEPANARWPAVFVGLLLVRSFGLAAEYDIELIAPHNPTRRSKTQDGRPLRRKRRRWKIERLFAWFHNFRRVVTRWERHPDNFLGMIHLASALILLRHF